MTNSVQKLNQAIAEHERRTAGDSQPADASLAANGNREAGHEASDGGDDPLTVARKHLELFDKRSNQDHIPALLETAAIELSGVEINDPPFIVGPLYRAAIKKKRMSKEHARRVLVKHLGDSWLKQVSDGSSDSSDDDGRDELKKRIDSYNDKFFSGIWHGKAVVMRRAGPGEEVEQYAPSDFKSIRDNDVCYVKDEGDKEKPIAVARAWWKHPTRERYDRVVFAPNQKVGKDTYNLFRGWPALPVSDDPRPADERCSSILDHLSEVICDGDEVHFDYLLMWMAAVRQFPEIKCGVSVVVKGSKGSGKGTIFEHFCKSFGPAHGVKVTNQRHVVGNFNAHLETCVLLLAEEALWGGDKSSEGTQKDLITSDNQFIERKGRDGGNKRSYVHLLMLANDGWTVPASDDERRYFVLKTNDEKCGDREYFNRLHADIEAGAFNAFLEYLDEMHVDFDTLRTAPKTDALAEQVSFTRSAGEAFFHEAIENGSLPLMLGHDEEEVFQLNEDSKTYIRCEALLQRWRAYVSQNARTKEPKTGSVMLDCFQRICGGERHEKCLNPDEIAHKAESEEEAKKRRANHYVFPSLETLRGDDPSAGGTDPGTDD